MYSIRSPFLLVVDEELFTQTPKEQKSALQRNELLQCK
jgi:hypothetical protein